jgi:hypothetical protein
MTDTTQLDEHQLSAMASKLRMAIGPPDGLPQYLREQLADTADVFDYAAEGKLDQAAVQAAVDGLNEAFDKQMTEAWDNFDRAEAGDDPDAWRDAMIRLIGLMPEWELRVIKDAFGIVLKHMLSEALKHFEQMPVAGSC